VAGCSLQSSVDGDLADDWRPLPAAQPFVPLPGCHQQAADDSATMADTAVVDCKTEHESETIYVGQLTGGIAESRDLPLPSNPGLAGAYTECSGRADALLGLSWVGFRLALRLILPSADAWHGGARWYACDLVEPEVVESETLRSRTAALQADTAIALRCLQTSVTGNTAHLSELDCARPHNTEYVGSFTATASQPPVSQADWKPYHDRCKALVGSYLGISYGQVEDRYSDVAGPVSDNFAAGQRGVRCYLWLGKTTMSGSAKGRKTGVPRWS